jgi:hypothetical protein
VAGEVTFTTKQATLTIDLPGTFNVGSGDFIYTGAVTGSSGKPANATGTLTLEGIQDLPTGEFTETIPDVICVDLE